MAHSEIEAQVSDIDDIEEEDVRSNIDDDADSIGVSQLAEEEEGPSFVVSIAFPRAYKKPIERATDESPFDVIGDHIGDIYLDSVGQE